MNSFMCFDMGTFFRAGSPSFFFRSLIRLQCTFPIFPLSQISDRYRGDYSRQTIRENRATTYEHIFKYLPSGIDSTIENINKTSSLLFPNTKCRYHRLFYSSPRLSFFFAAGLLIKREPPRSKQGKSVLIACFDFSEAKEVRYLKTKEIFFLDDFFLFD